MAQTSSHKLSTISDATSSLSQLASFSSAHDGCGIFNVNGPPQMQTDFFMHNMAPADISLFDKNFTGSLTNPMWNVQPMLTENVTLADRKTGTRSWSVSMISWQKWWSRGY
ncbi:hypothetical protein E1B28_003894 [Marasmius oreades]|uniref:Uncharacterized protein n=1 Tax=Marasmius oreades TaxID=181124 RepID=A0A9P8AB69_9AGAR|nr:uncharacterized protein E1B28_003894 [Marasmius oreades]KAG7096461.1 hypothetical protein E1B28_003894 [Marasmius oreades]